MSRKPICLKTQCFQGSGKSRFDCRRICSQRTRPGTRWSPIGCTRSNAKCNSPSPLRFCSWTRCCASSEYWSFSDLSNHHLHRSATQQPRPQPHLTLCPGPLQFYQFPCPFAWLNAISSCGSKCHAPWCLMNWFRPVSPWTVLIFQALFTASLPAPVWVSSGRVLATHGQKAKARPVHRMTCCQLFSASFTWFLAHEFWSMKPELRANRQTDRLLLP